MNDDDVEGSSSNKSVRSISPFSPAVAPATTTLPADGTTAEDEAEAEVSSPQKIAEALMKSDMTMDDFVEHCLKTVSSGNYHADPSADEDFVSGGARRGSQNSNAAVAAAAAGAVGALSRRRSSKTSTSSTQQQPHVAVNNAPIEAAKKRREPPQPLQQVMEENVGGGDDDDDDGVDARAPCVLSEPEQKLVERADDEVFNMIASKKIRSYSPRHHRTASGRYEILIEDDPVVDTGDDDDDDAGPPPTGAGAITNQNKNTSIALPASENKATVTISTRRGSKGSVRKETTTAADDKNKNRNKPSAVAVPASEASFSSIVARDDGDDDDDGGADQVVGDGDDNNNIAITSAASASSATKKGKRRGDNVVGRTIRSSSLPSAPPPSDAAAAGGAKSRHHRTHSWGTVVSLRDLSQRPEEFKQWQLAETRQRVCSRTNSDIASSIVSSRRGGGGSIGVRSAGSGRESGRSSVTAASSRRRRQDHHDDRVDDLLCCCSVIIPSADTLWSLFWFILLPCAFFAMWVGLFRASGQGVCEAGACACSEGMSVLYAFSVGFVINCPRSVFFAFILEMVMTRSGEPPLRTARVWLLATFSVFSSVAADAIVGTIFVPSVAYHSARFIAVIMPSLVYAVIGGESATGIAIAGLQALPLCTDFIKPVYLFDDWRRWLMCLWPLLMLMSDRVVTHLLFMLLPAQVKLTTVLAIAYSVTVFFQMTVVGSGLALNFEFAGLAIVFPVSVCVCEALHNLHIVDVFFTWVFRFVAELLQSCTDFCTGVVVRSGVVGVAEEQQKQEEEEEEQKKKNNNGYDNNKHNNRVVGDGGSQQQLQQERDPSSTAINHTEDEATSSQHYNNSTSTENGKRSGGSNNNLLPAATHSTIQQQVNDYDRRSKQMMGSNSSGGGGDGNGSSSSRGEPQQKVNKQSSFHTNDLRLMGSFCRISSLCLVGVVAIIQLAINRFPKKYAFSTCEGTLEEQSTVSLWWVVLGICIAALVVGQIIALVARIITDDVSSSSTNKNRDRASRRKNQSRVVAEEKKNESCCCWLDARVLMRAVTFFPIPGRFLPLLAGMTFANWYLQALFTAKYSSF